MRPGQKHSEETRRKISENTKKAMKTKPLNKTAFRPGNIPWNAGLKGVMSVNSGSFQPVPIGTITTRKNNGYEYQYIKTSSGWQRYFPNGQSFKVQDQSTALKKLFGKSQVATKPKKEKIIIEKIAPPKKEVITPKIIEPEKPILSQAEIKRLQKEKEKEIKLQQEIERKKQAQREWLAQFGITNSIIRVELKRAEQ